MNATNLAKMLLTLGVASLSGVPALAQTASGNPSASSGMMAPMTSNSSGTTTPKNSGPSSSGTASSSSHIGGASHKDLPADERFSTESAASAHCPGNVVEWTTLTHAKLYHSAGSKYYAKTKHGAFACKADLDAAGYHQAKN